jgi:hypothetical protein
MIGSARAGTIAEKHSCGPNFKALKCTYSRARPESCFFPLTWTYMDDRPLDDLKEFSTTMAADINDLPTTSPHGSDFEHDA